MTKPGTKLEESSFCRCCCALPLQLALQRRRCRALPAEPRVELDFYRMDNAPCHHH
jgi:hypothetical protein